MNISKMRPFQAHSHTSNLQGMILVNAYKVNQTTKCRESRCAEGCLIANIYNKKSESEEQNLSERCRARVSSSERELKLVLSREHEEYPKRKTHLAHVRRRHGALRRAKLHANMGSIAMSTYV